MTGPIEIRKQCATFHDPPQLTSSQIDSAQIPNRTVNISYNDVTSQVVTSESSSNVMQCSFQPQGFGHPSDVGVSGSRVKARSQQVSLSDTLLSSVEHNIRQASSHEQISDVIDQLVNAMEGAIRQHSNFQNDVTKIKKEPPPLKPKPSCTKLREVEVERICDDTPVSCDPQKRTPPALKPKPKLSAAMKVRETSKIEEVSAGEMLQQMPKKTTESKRKPVVAKKPQLKHEKPTNTVATEMIISPEMEGERCKPTTTTTDSSCPSQLTNHVTVARMRPIDASKYFTTNDKCSTKARNNLVRAVETRCSQSGSALTHECQGHTFGDVTSSRHQLSESSSQLLVAFVEVFAHRLACDVIADSVERACAQTSLTSALRELESEFDNLLMEEQHLRQPPPEIHVTKAQIGDEKVLTAEERALITRSDSAHDLVTTRTNIMFSSAMGLSSAAVAPQVSTSFNEGLHLTNLWEKTQSNPEFMKYTTSNECIRHQLLQPPSMTQGLSGSTLTSLSDNTPTLDASRSSETLSSKMDVTSAGSDEVEDISCDADDDATESLSLDQLANINKKMLDPEYLISVLDDSTDNLDTSFTDDDVIRMFDVSDSMASSREEPNIISSEQEHQEVGLVRKSSPKDLHDVTRSGAATPPTTTTDAASSPDPMYDDETVAYYTGSDAGAALAKHFKISRLISSDSECYTTDSEVDVNEYRTFVSDSLVRTDPDAAEVAQFNRTPSVLSSISDGHLQTKSVTSSEFGDFSTDVASEVETEEGLLHFMDSGNAEALRQLQEETEKLTQNLLLTSAPANTDVTSANVLQAEVVISHFIPNQDQPESNNNDFQPYFKKRLCETPDTSSCTDATTQSPKYPKVVANSSDRSVLVVPRPTTLFSSSATEIGQVLKAQAKQTEFSASISKNILFSPTRSSAFSIRNDDQAIQSRQLLLANQKPGDVTGTHSKLVTSSICVRLTSAHRCRSSSSVEELDRGCVTSPINPESSQETPASRCTSKQTTAIRRHSTGSIRSDVTTPSQETFDSR